MRGNPYRVMKWNHLKLFPNYHILSLSATDEHGGRRSLNVEGSHRSSSAATTSFNTYVTGGNQAGQRDPPPSKKDRD